jgi:LysR family hydrogen peroxide-inducible transcriptional activator
MPTLPHVLNNFIKKHPKVKLIIEELNTEEINLKKMHISLAANINRRN